MVQRVETVCDVSPELQMKINLIMLENSKEISSFYFKLLLISLSIIIKGSGLPGIPVGASR